MHEPTAPRTSSSAHNCFERWPEPGFNVSDARGQEISSPPSNVHEARLFDAAVATLRRQFLRADLSTALAIIAKLDDVSREVRVRGEMDGVPQQNWGELWDFLTL